MAVCHLFNYCYFNLLIVDRIGVYENETYPTASSGQENNEFKNFDGTYGEYNNMLEIL